MFPIINIGPLAIQAPGLIIIIGLYVWLSINDYSAKKLNLDPTILSNHFFYSLLIGLAGARLAVIAQSPQSFINNPLSLISPNLALFDIQSGILIAIFAFYLFTTRKKQNLLRTLDALSLGFVVFLAFLALSFLANGKLYGASADLAWSIDLWGTKRHPLQLYYLIAFFLTAYPVYRLLHIKSSPGLLILTSLSLLSFSVIFLDAFRGSQALITAGVHLPQIIAFMALAFSLFGIKSLLNKEMIFSEQEING